jgi:hypothetical protein
LWRISGDSVYRKEGESARGVNGGITNSTALAEETTEKDNAETRGEVRRSALVTHFFREER